MANPEIVNGRTANLISFGSLAGNPLGTYRQIGIKKWEEVNVSNVVGFRFNEVQRDEWSVYLHDPSRNVSLQLDLHRKIIVYSDGNNNRFDLYKVLSASSKVNGWMANQASFSSLDGKPLGEYRQTGQKTWIEFNKNGDAVFAFAESQRDDWSIYMHDASRKVSIQIDLHRKKIVYSDPGTQRIDLYAVASAAAVSEKAALTPPLRGKSVNLLDFSSLDGKALGHFRQTGAFTWVETDINNQIRFYFTETQRHNGAIYLFDPSRYVTLELNLNANKIIYSDAAANRFELYSISKAYSKINGWVANRIGFCSLDKVPLGEYRQTGENTWVELNHLRQVAFRFEETHRDDWSVYLHDASRNVRLQLDLHTEKIIYSDSANRFELYAIQYASPDPSNVIVTSPLPVKSQNVNTVAFGALNSKPLGYYRQIGESSWVEVGANHQVGFTFNEVRRDKDSVYLNDPSRNVSLQINLRTQRIIYSDPNNKFDLYTVLRTSATLNGWIVSEVTFGSFAGAELGKYRQTETKAWAEFDKSGKVGFHFKEVKREDWSIYLHDASRNVSLQLDLHSQQIIYSDQANSGVKLYKILSESVEPGIWLHSERITSRTSMTEDFQVNPGNKKLVSKPVYRTSVTVTSVTGFVDVWASEQVTVEINGTSYTIDPVKSAQVRPDQFSKLSISIPATDVRCPNLMLRTNLMMPEQRHHIFPDIEAHKKIVGLKEGDLYNSRERLGISTQYTKENVDHFQQALQNIAKTVQHTYNKTTHGVHHDRALLPRNMEHPHFVVDFNAEGPLYRPLHHSEVPQHIAGARLIQENAAQGFFDEVGKFFKKAASVVVHTVENVGHDIVQTVENIGGDIVHTIDQVGEDIVHGDIGHIGQDLLQGGENIGGDLVKGAGNVVGDVVSGAGQLVVITLKAADEAVQFVLTHTGAVGRVLGELFNKIGAELSKVVDWLLDKIGWSDVLHTHDVLFDFINSKLDEAKAYPEMLKQQADKFFTHLADVVSEDIDKALNQFDVLKLAKQPQPAQGHSGAVEKIEWLLGKYAQHSSGATALAFPGLPGGQDPIMNDLLNLIEQQLGKDGGKILGAPENAGVDIKGIFTNSDHAPEYLIGAVLEIVKAVAILGLDAIKVIFDFLMDLIEALIQGFKDMINAPWQIPFISDLYEAITEGRKMTFLSFVSLLISIPTTIIHRAVFNEPPFKSGTVAASLNPMPGNARAFGIVYGVCHIVLTPIAIITDIRTAISANDAGIDSLFGFGDGPNAPASLSKPDLGINILSLAVGFLAQFKANPIPIGEPYSMPLDHAKDDVFEAPGYWGHVIWWYQWAGWTFNALATGAIHTTSGLGAPQKAVKGLGNFITVFNTVWGIVHMALMVVLDVADRTKSNSLTLLDATHFSNLPALELFRALERNATERSGHQPYWTFSETETVSNGITVEEWVANARNYYQWSKIPAGGGIPNKGFGNIMDTFPEIGQIGAMPAIAEDTLGLSLIGTALFDTLGHLGEGITYIVRTSKDELL